MVRLVTIAGAAGGLVALWLPGGAVRPERPDLDVVLGAAGLVAVAALSFAPGPRTRLVTDVLAAAVAGWALLNLTRDILSGLPGSSTAVLAVSSLVVLAALVAAAVRPLHVALSAGLVVVLVAAAVGAGLLAPRVPARASEAPAVTAAAPADRPGDRRWTWRSPARVLGVAVAGAGVVVATSDGQLSALDGPSGHLRWSYARPGAHVRALVATPDRATVLAAFAPGGGRDTGARLLVVLDAVTGAVLQESTVDEWVADPDFLVPTDTVLPVRDRVGEDDHTVRGLDLRTGEQRWTWSAPAGCTSPFLLPRSGADVVLTSLRCADRLGVVALDDRTGSPRWEYTRPATRADGRPEFHLRTSPDGATVALHVLAPGLRTRMNLLLRTEDGVELTTVEPSREARLDVGARPLLLGRPGDEIGPQVVDPDTGDLLEFAPADCVAPRATATTATTHLRICGSPTEAFLTWQDFTGGPLSRTPLDWGPAPVSSWLLNRRAPSVVLPAPGAIVVARAGDHGVLGYPG